MDAGHMVAKEATEAAMDYLEQSNDVAKITKFMVEVGLEDNGYETVENGFNSY